MGWCGGEHGGAPSPVRAQAGRPPLSESEVCSSHPNNPPAGRWLKPCASVPCLGGVPSPGGRATGRGPHSGTFEHQSLLRCPGVSACPAFSWEPCPDPFCSPSSLCPPPPISPPPSPAFVLSLRTKKPLHQHTPGVSCPSPAPCELCLTSRGWKVAQPGTLGAAGASPPAPGRPCWLAVRQGRGRTAQHSHVHSQK